MLMNSIYHHIHTYIRGLWEEERLMEVVIRPGLGAGYDEVISLAITITSGRLSFLVMFGVLMKWFEE